jgi:hypothetical protein
VSIYFHKPVGSNPIRVVGKWIDSYGCNLCLVNSLVSYGSFVVVVECLFTMTIRCAEWFLCSGGGVSIYYDKQVCSNPILLVGVVMAAVSIYSHNLV